VHPKLTPQVPQNLQSALNYEVHQKWTPKVPRILQSAWWWWCHQNKSKITVTNHAVAFIIMACFYVASSALSDCSSGNKHNLTRRALVSNNMRASVPCHPPPNVPLVDDEFVGLEWIWRSNWWQLYNTFFITTSNHNKSFMERHFVEWNNFWPFWLFFSAQENGMTLHRNATSCNNWMVMQPWWINHGYIYILALQEAGIRLMGILQSIDYVHCKFLSRRRVHLDNWEMLTLCMYSNEKLANRNLTRRICPYILGWRQVYSHVYVAMISWQTNITNPICY